MTFTAADARAISDVAQTPEAKMQRAEKKISDAARNGFSAVVLMDYEADKFVIADLIGQGFKVDAQGSNPR
jgi:uncharacterized protein with PhoU and TrkA domain